MQKSIPVFAWALLISLAMIWGSSFILIKKGLAVFSPEELGAFRIFMAFLAFMPIGLQQVSKIDRKKLPVLFVVGFVGSFLPAFLFAIAQTQLDSSITGVLNSLTPLFVLLIGILFFHQKIKLSNSLGVGLGFLGSAIIMLGGVGFDISGINYYGFFVILATVMYGLNVNLIKFYLPDIKALHITAVALLLTSPICGVYLFLFTEFLSKWNTHPLFWEGFAYISILGVFGTAIALVIFNKLVQIASPIFASSVTYLIPIVAIGWGILDGETIQFEQYLGIAIILSGVYLANKKDPS